MTFIHTVFMSFFKIYDRKIELLKNVDDRSDRFFFIYWGQLYYLNETFFIAVRSHYDSNQNNFCRPCNMHIMFAEYCQSCRCKFIVNYSFRYVRI